MHMRSTSSSSFGTIHFNIQDKFMNEDYAIFMFKFPFRWLLKPTQLLFFIFNLEL